MNKAKHPLYQRWYNIMHRCYQEHSYGWKYAGALGLKVYKPWHTFERFAEDIEQAYGWPQGRDSQLARKDITKGWFPSNITGWTTHQDVARNRRENFMITYNGETRPLCEWGEITGIRASTIWSRLHDRGYTIKQALTKKPNKGDRI